MLKKEKRLLGSEDAQYRIFFISTIVEMEHENWWHLHKKNYVPYPLLSSIFRFQFLFQIDQLIQHLLSTY